MASLFRVRTAIAGGSGASQVSTQYFEDSGSLTAQHAADAVSGFWGTLVSVISSAYTFKVENNVYQIDVASGQPTGIVAVTSSLITGGVVTDALPWQTQWVLRWNTGSFLGGRQVLGHTFIPGATEGNNSAGVPDSGSRGVIDGAAAAVNGSALCNLMIYSRKNGQALNVLNGATWTKWGVLRSRRD